jgi:GNAT superfamily N-acetyltransferase
MILRTATREDLPEVVALIAREDAVAEVPVEPDHVEAFEAIDADERNELLVAAGDDGMVLACLQVTYIPGLGRARERAHVEAVRVRADRRGEGIGRELLAWTVERARARGCTSIQLTSNKRRADAHRFYLSLGFVCSHDGFKLAL